MSEEKNEQLKDRIGEFLIPHVNDYIFDELSENYLKKAGLYDVLNGVPVPINKSQLSEITNLNIARGMAVVIGCDLNFKYRDNYIEYIKRTFGVDFVKPLINEGVESAAKSDFDYACICFRAALLIDPENVDALYCYGRACKDSYETGEGEDYVGRYKAEALETFEKLTIVKPDFDMGFYYLAYAYLNLGLYLKASLTFGEFIKLNDDENELTPEKEALVNEVKEWLEKLEEPVKIESGYNHVLSGRYEEGIEVLFPYTEDDRFNSWWPLWYYLGLAYKGTGDDNAAEDSFLECLKISPSNIEVMEELVKLYQEYGNEELEDKYARKIEIVKSNREMDKAERNKNYQ